METLIELPSVGHLPMAELLTPEEFAERLKVSLRTVYRWLHAGKIPGAGQYGALWRIPDTALEEMRTRPKSAARPKR